MSLGAFFEIQCHIIRLKFNFFIKIFDKTLVFYDKLHKFAPLTLKL
jgi:hypothetical protein